MKELSQFAADVLDGLLSSPKSLSSKYFYDDEGSRLFREIMNLPEYYLTNCESEILNKHSDEIRDDLINGHDGIDIVELGAGDGIKTALLIESLLLSGVDITYSPIDISQEAVDTLSNAFAARFPGLRVNSLVGDYFEVLASLSADKERRKVILFLGSNIGNICGERAVEFFRGLHNSMNTDDLLFVGFDLQKDPDTILRAYDDSAGITARFNMNLLTRMNRELGADFDLKKFTHFANYDPIEGSARSYLISREKQSVEVKELGRTFEFDQWEPMFMEISQKYSINMIEDLAARGNFSVKRNYFDSRIYFCDSLWQMR